jgi:ACR3 family arsenite transporter
MRRQNALERIRDHLDEWLGLYVGLMIVLGLVVGYHSINWIKLHERLLRSVEIAAIYMMIFPMMLLMDIESLRNAFKNHKLVTTVAALNFLYSPLMAFLLGYLFIDDPFVRLGLFIAWAVPCSSMSIGYVGLMQADVGAATAMVTLSFLLSLILLPTETSLYISKFMTFHMGGLKLSGTAIRSIEIGLVKTILMVLIVPLVVALPTREVMLRRLGFRRFREIRPLFPIITMLGMFTIIFTLFFANARTLVTRISDVLGVFYSAMTFGSLSLTLFTVLFKYLKLNDSRQSPYSAAMTAILTGIPKNEATAIAITTLALASLGQKAAFLASLAPSLLPAFQVVFIITYLKLRSKLMKYYGVVPAKETVKVPAKLEERFKV